MHCSEIITLLNTKNYSVLSWIRTIKLSIYRVIKTIYALYMHVHTNDVIISQCNSIANNKNLLLLQIWGFGFGDDGTGPVNESKRTKRVQGWSRQIMGGRFLLFAILLHCEITTSLV